MGKRSWRRELLHNTNGFLISKDRIVEIMDEVEKNANANTSPEILYKRAWRRIFDMI